MTTMRELERDLKNALKRIEALELQLEHSRCKFNPYNPDPTPALTPGWPFFPTTGTPLPPLPTITCSGGPVS